MPFWKRGELLPIEVGEPIEKLRDLTERLSSREDELRSLTERVIKERNFLHHILDTNPTLIFVKDLESRYIVVNDKVSKAFGLPREQIVGKRDCDIVFIENETPKFHENDIDVILNKREKLIPIEVFTNVKGETRYFSTIKTPIIEEDGSCTMLLGVATDITHLFTMKNPIGEILKGYIGDRLKSDKDDPTSL